jgi:hypothetical protein
MRDASRRPWGRLSCWAVIVMGAWVLSALSAWAAAGRVTPQGGGLTTVADTVYMADGTPAQGILIITWPAFVTASGAAVAGGNTSVTLGTGGALNVALEPNAGATPAGSYYTVVYQLGAGEVKTEYWLVPVSSSPVNLATVITTPGSGAAAQPVSMQYVNTELATKANDNAVVHLAGAETITGVKSFSAIPNVPTPVNPGDVANKGYVDQSVSNAGSGVYLPTAGGTMTGPIILPANPAAAMQAATKQYVDTGLASSASLIAGLVPANELGSGPANAGSCLMGNGASAVWSSCGGGSGGGNLSTNPTANQAIEQPEGTEFSANDLANIRYVTPSWNWAQTPTDNLSTPGNLTIHLAPCPLGIDTNSSTEYYSYKVYIAGTGTPEAVPVTGGSCPPGATSGTITVTTTYAHGAGYTVGSASSGIQEAWNDGWSSDGGYPVQVSYVKLMADTQYNVYATVYLRGRGGMLDGAGALIVCSTRDRCIYIGTTAADPAVNYHKVYNLSGTSTLNVDGVQVASVTASSGTYTLTSATNHPFVVGDTVDCEYHAQNADQHWTSVVTSVLSSTKFTVSFGSNTFAAGSTFGFCNLLNAFVEDNSDHVAMQDINIYQTYPAGMGYFSYGVVNDNDQQFIIARAANRATPILQSTANWPIGAFFYQRTDQGNSGIMYIHDSELSGVNCATGGGNGFVMTDSVCQGFPMYGVRYFGGLQPATFENIYQESTGGTFNPLYGYAAQAGYVVQGGTGTKILGTFPIQGYEPVFATGGGSATQRTYFVVPRSSTQGYGPVLLIGWAEPANGSTSIPLLWPSVEFYTTNGQNAGTVTWDVLVTTGTSASPPFGTGNYAIATNLSGACGTNGMCSFTDTQAAASSYTVAAQAFTPEFWFWPVNLAIDGGVLLVDQIGFDPQAVASQGALGVSIVAEQCLPGGWTWRRSPIWVSCLASGNNGGSGLNATVLQEQDQANNGPPANTKGRLNFGKPLSGPTDLLTLQDSNFAKTMATAGQRPSNDVGDMALGLDQTGGLAQRAAASISSYINVLPSGTNYQERLTAAAKTFNVPVTVNGNLAVTGTTTFPITGSGAQCLQVNSTGALSGTGANCGSGTVNGGVASQVAVYSGSGAAVSGDSALTDNGTTLNYAGAGGIAAASGTFSGNLTVNGQLMVAGPWTVSSPVPGTPMGASGAGTSALGISNDGNFYISANGGTPQKIATTATSSYFSNLFQEDANDLGEYNPTSSTAAQNLHVYSSYTNSSSWQRTSVGFDASDNYAVLRSESSTAGAAPGIGLWINNGLKWVIDATNNFKPWTDQAYNIGSFSGSSGVGLRPATVFAGGNTTSGSGFELGKFASNSYELCNDTTNGTVINGLAILTSAGCAMKPSSAVTTGVIGVVIANAGTSGTVTLVRTGSAYCNFDGTATVMGDYVVPSATQNPLGSGFYPLCHDAGSTLPSGQQILGRVLQATSGGTTAQMFFDMPGSSVGPNSVSSVFGRTGVVNAQSGDYSVSQVTGAAPLASPTFSGTVTEPDGTTNTSSGYAFAHALTLPSGSVATTPSAGDNTTKVATTAYVRSEAQFAWTCPVAGSTLVSQNCNWTIPAALTITGFDFAANTAPAACTTYATVQVWDGTAAAEVGSYSITLSSGTNFYTQVTGSTNVAAGHQLRVKVTTAAAGCSTNAAGLVATVTYQMQN